MTLRVQTMQAPSYTFQPKERDGAIHVVFTGTGDLVAVGPLGLFLNDLREDAVRLKAKKVVLDLRKLYFLNSSCLKAFVNLVFFFKSTGLPIAVEFVTDKNLTWQERAVSPIFRMSKDTVTLVTA